MQDGRFSYHTDSLSPSTKQQRARWKAPVLAFTVAVLVFAPTVLRCGFYADDYSFMLDIGGKPWSEVWGLFTDFYLAGRNVFVPLFAGLLKLTGSPAALHAISLMVNAATAALVCLLVLELTGLMSASLAAAVIFAILPHHGQTHFWLTATTVVQIPLLITLAAFLVALGRKPRLETRLGLSLGLYTIAIFTYDQFFCLWPLLLAAPWYRADREARKSRAWIAAGAYCAALNLTHLWLRYNPAKTAATKIRFTGIHERLWQSVSESLQALAPSPFAEYGLSYGWTAAAGAAFLIGGAALAVVLHRLATLERPALKKFSKGPELKFFAVYAGAWFFLAYLPNYFAYIAPRNHSVPSVGWAMLVVAAALSLAPKRRWAPKALSAAGIVSFALMALHDNHEGAQWVLSGRMHRDYLAETKRLEDPLDNIFLIGAPRYLGSAPAFNLHLDAVHSAQFDRGLKELEGDIVFSPTRRGAFYQNDLSFRRISHFRWMPYEEMNVIEKSPGEGFRCLKDFTLLLPDGSSRRGATRPDPACTRHSILRMNTALLSAESLPSVRSSTITWLPSLEKVGLSGLRLAVKGKTLFLGLQWEVAKTPQASFAVIPEIFSADGKRIYQPVYPHLAEGRNSRLLWPLVNDILPATRWREGRTIRERYALRLKKPLPPGRGEVRLFLYRLNPRAASQSLGTLRVSVLIPRPS